MRILPVAVILAILPFSAFAQTDAVAPPAKPAESGGVSVLAITAGVLGVAVVADILSGGALSGPLLRVAGLEASAVAPAAAPVAAPAAIAPVAAAPAAATAAPVLARPWWRFW